jgi:hypothetical protein
MRSSIPRRLWRELNIFDAIFGQVPVFSLSMILRFLFVWMVSLVTLSIVASWITPEPDWRFGVAVHLISVLLAYRDKQSEDRWWSRHDGRSGLP